MQQNGDTLKLQMNISLRTSCPMCQIFVNAFAVEIAF